MNSKPQDSETPQAMPPNMKQGASSSPIGPVFIVAAVILVIAGLGYFVMIGRSMENDVSPSLTALNTSGTTVDASTSSDPAATALAQQGTSDEVGAIDKDLNATDLSSLGDPNTVQ